MKKITSTVDIEQISTNLLRNMEIQLRGILNTLDLQIEDLNFLINKLSDKEKDKVMEKTINKELKLLEPVITIDKYKEIVNKVNIITDYYTSSRDNFKSIAFKSNDIATDLLFNVIYNNFIELPIKIHDIKELCLSSGIKKEQLYDSLLWIALRYVAISKCIAWNEHNKSYDESKDSDII